MTSSNFHQSVLLKEALSYLKFAKNYIYVDCTLGMGGHSSAIIKNMDNSSRLICFDKDHFAITNFRKQLNKQNSNVILIHDDFNRFDSYLKSLNITSVNAFLFDLGVSSPQIDNAERGFSFQHNGPLDMRMDSGQKLTASHIINHYSQQELSLIFKKYGESKYANSVAKMIIKIRKLKPITTTFELVDVIKSALPKKELVKNKHPAKVFFQALRIVVNNELDNLSTTIFKASRFLAPGGLIMVISFHSLEDRIIKSCFHELTTSKMPKYLPINHDENIMFEYVKIVQPSTEELALNSRSRSAKLRIIKRKENYEKK